MPDPQNHSFISNSKIRKLVFTWMLFIFPVLLILLLTEYTLRKIPFPEKVKKNYIEAHNEEIEILVLGSSLTERAINPIYITRPTINLANSSQRLYENYQLLKYFNPKLPALKLVVIEVAYDILQRDKSFTSEIIDRKNLAFYNVNTFDRSVKLIDRFMFSSNPNYFSNALKEYFFDKSKIKLNEFGFDENKFDGSFEAVQHKDSLIYDKDIFIENVENNKAFLENSKLLFDIIDYCKIHDLRVLIYSPPTHSRLNKLRDPKLVKKRDSVLTVLKDKNPDILFYIEDTNPEFQLKYFYNADHLNPDGAKKASQNLNRFIMDKFY